MPKIAYIEKNLGARKIELIEKANRIIGEYAAQGYDLTLRQLYYQFVARGWVENTLRSYKNLGSAIDDGRLLGMIDWSAIVDRLRPIRSNAHWSDPEDIVGACAGQFQIDKWEDQPHHVEVWIEKDALAGVIEGVCAELDVPWLACRGYGSQSALWRASQRMLRAERIRKDCVVIHLGDHDPSGIDMTRDIHERLARFGTSAEVDRIALNMDQVHQYNPPPNPAKLSDSRFDSYVRTYGDDSWELDAIDPVSLSALVREAVLRYRDETIWEEDVEREERAKVELRVVADNWRRAVEAVSDEGGSHA